jgi:DNA-binding beta-propeller fold protein YncE
MRFVVAGAIALAVAASLSISAGCGKGLFPLATNSGTITPTPVGNAYLYATNFNDGTVSAFTRNTNTGSLGFISKINAGAVQGPEGIAVSGGNSWVYVANQADGNIYQYSIATSGVLGSLTSLGKISSGNTPQMVAIDSSNTYVYVTNLGSKTVTEYLISSTGTLSLIGSVGNFVGQPFSVFAHPSLGLVYVADNAGLIYAYSVGSNGFLSQIGVAVNSNGSSRGNPGLMAIAIDSTQSYLLIDDRTFGVVSVFTIQSNGGLVYGNTFGVSQSSSTLGIGAVNNPNGSSFNYVITANTNGNFLQPYTRSGVTLTQQSSVADSTGPTGLVIDPAGLFAYTGNSGSGTIALIGLNSSQCGSLAVCVIQSFAGAPNTSNPGTQFVATTH